VLSSVAPPPKALASIGNASTHAGPGPIANVFEESGYRLELHVVPNRAAVPNDFTVRITRGGAPVRGADVTATFTMLDMLMPAQSFKLDESAPGEYARSTPALVMVGHWGISLQVTPRAGKPFGAVLVDRAGG
jgi:copper transport protein